MKMPTFWWAFSFAETRGAVNSFSTHASNALTLLLGSQILAFHHVKQINPPKGGLYLFAETRGFEPPKGFTPYLISSEAHSTGLCDVS
ncbi:MAG: hypothetical protein RL228_477 [Actinomycetota bacterium]